jgi:hypothetical protein
MMKALTCVFGLALLLGASCFAQDVTGSIAGTVTDPSGAGVPNAKVTITNLDRNAVIRTATTDGSGNYSAPLLPLGAYAVAVEASGFKTAATRNIRLNVNDKLTVNMTLEVGQMTETVTVEAAPVEVDTQTATAANLITGVQIRELSLNNRNYEQLVALMPGVSNGASDQLYIGATNPLGTNTVSFAINGQRNSANYWTIDGADNVDRGSNLTLLNYPSIDSLAEFKVLRGLYTAEFGRAGGGQINVVTKSGTNQFHGNAYEFVRNNAFAANNWWNNSQRLNLGSDGKANVPPLRYNDFGYTFGGPIYIPGKFNKDKNKTFFFFSQEFRRVITYATTTVTTATDNEKKGIFATPVCIANTGSTCNQTTTQITNINPVTAAYIQDIFSKVPGSNPADHLLSFNARNVYNARQELIRIDHMFNEKFSVWGRMLNDSIPTVEPGGLFQGSTFLPGVGITTTNAPGRTWVFHANWNLRPSLIMEGGYNKSYGAITSDPSGLSASANSPDIKVNLPYPVTLGRVPTVGFGTTGYGPYRDYNRNHSAYDNITWIKGRHTFKFGASVNRYQKSENNAGNNVGTFAFASTANPAGTPTIAQQWANFLLGNVSNFTQNSLDVTPDVRAWQWEAYAQDDFRLKPNLTLSLGVRYSFFGQPWDENKMLTNFDPSLWSAAKAPQIDATGNMVPNTGDPLNGISINNQTSPYGNKIANNSKKDFAPRLGLAWDPFGKGRTSIRTGYGVYYDAMLFGVYEQNIFNNVPYVQSLSILNTRLENPTAGTPSVSLSPKVIRGTPVPYSTPYVQQWSFGIQQQLGASGLLDVSYVGTKGTHLLGIVDINEVPVGAGLAAGLHTGAGTAFTSADTPKLNALRPYRGFNAINTLETAFDSNYHSLQVAFDRRFGSAGTFGFSYTWSHNLTDNQSDRSNAPQNSYNWHNGEYGPASLDRRHVVTFNYTYELPFFKNASAAPRLLLAGWQISGSTQIGSGTPLTATTSATDPAGLGILGSSSAGPRPDMICDPNQGAPHTILAWFNTACFADVPAGQVRPGNAGRGTILGPGYQNWNLSLFKNLHFSDRWRMQIRGESFNFINHPNPLAPTVAITSTLYGKITGFHDPRIIQLGVKLSF